MPVKTARAEVAQLRQQTQFTCCATSIAAALRAHGKDVSEDDVNRVLNASPMAGASWEAMLATVQYFGCRGTLVVPATPRMLKAWTDAGVPVVIAWNPEGRPWSHASTVYDVVEGEDGKLTVYVMDPNIPNPTETTRILGEDEFCQKWGEKVSESLIMRRPAMAVEREVTTEGRQVIASSRTASVKVAEEYDCLKDYRAGALSREDYLRCVEEEKRRTWKERRQREQAEMDAANVAAASRERTRVDRWHYTMHAELGGLEDVRRWLRELVSRHRTETMTFVPSAAAQGFPPEFVEPYMRVVFTGELNPGERAEFHELLSRHPDLNSRNRAATIERVRGLIQAESEEETAKREVATERAAPYLVDPKYRDRWYVYDFADADSPEQWHWTYIDDDGVIADVSATVDWGHTTRKRTEIRNGSVEVSLYKFDPADPPRKVWRIAEHGIDRSKTHFVRRAVVRAKSIDDVVPNVTPFILRVKGEQGFNDDDLVSQAKAERDRRRQETEAQAVVDTRPTQPHKTVVDSALAEKFAILDRIIAGGFPQARDIAREVKGVYEAGGKPTEDQLKALRNMMYRSRMKAEADHFRVASSDLEATWWGDDVTAHTAKVTDTVKIKKEDLPKHRHGPEYVQDVMRRPGAGTHHTRTKDVDEGRSRKEKHKKNWSDREADELTTAWGNT